MPRRYIILAIAIVASVVLFYLTQAVLENLLVPKNAGFFESFGGELDSTYYSYLGVFLLLVVESVIGIIVGRRKGRIEVKMGSVFTLVYAVVITVAVILILKYSN